MFKMLFRDELYTLEDVMRSAEKNPDVLWVVYEARRSKFNNPEDMGKKVGTMSCATIVHKYG
jgi:hypothetical protein